MSLKEKVWFTEQKENAKECLFKKDVDLAVEEIKNSSIDGKEIGFDSETGGYYFWNKDNDVEFDLDSYVLIPKKKFKEVFE